MLNLGHNGVNIGLAAWTNAVKAWGLIKIYIIYIKIFFYCCLDGYNARRMCSISYPSFTSSKGSVCISSCAESSSQLRINNKTGWLSEALNSGCGWCINSVSGCALWLFPHILIFAFQACGSSSSGWVIL